MQVHAVGEIVAARSDERVVRDDRIEHGVEETGAAVPHDIDRRAQRSLRTVDENIVPERQILYRRDGDGNHRALHVVPRDIELVLFNGDAVGGTPGPDGIDVQDLSRRISSDDVMDVVLADGASRTEETYTVGIGSSDGAGVADVV